MTETRTEEPAVSDLYRNDHPARPATVQDWAAAVSGYIGEAYAMEPFELAELISVVTRDFALEGFDPNPAGVALPLRVREHITAGAELTRALGREALAGRPPAGEPIVVGPAVWADFACRYLEYSSVLSPAAGLTLWHRLSLTLAEFDLAERPVAYLSVPLQQSLPIDGATPRLDAPAVLQ